MHQVDNENVITNSNRYCVDLRMTRSLVPSWVECLFSNVIQSIKFRKLERMMYIRWSMVEVKRFGDSSRNAWSLDSVDVFWLWILLRMWTVAVNVLKWNQYLILLKCIPWKIREGYVSFTVSLHSNNSNKSNLLRYTLLYCTTTIMIQIIVQYLLCHDELDSVFFSTYSMLK